MKVDVAVLGGGPAGTAIALELVKRGYSTVVIERYDYSGVRIGETLPPAIQPLLARLGIWDQFLGEKHSPSFSIQSAWGRDELRENDSIFSPYGVGWHLDRARFDCMLARCADEAGAVVYRGARLESLENHPTGTWSVAIAQGDQRYSFSAKFLIDASGRSSYTARSQGSTRVAWDRLIGVISFFSSTSEKPPSANSTVIEASDNGWWYSAVLPTSNLVLAYMTDADLYTRAGRHSVSCWSHALETTKHTRLRAEKYELASAPHVVSANTSRLDRVTNGSWAAIGDAAMAFDPLSGQGVFKALQSALQVAESVDRYWNGDVSALDQYAETVDQDFKRYLLKRSSFYSAEQRWPSSPFWQRRVSNFNKRTLRT